MSPSRRTRRRLERERARHARPVRPSRGPAARVGLAAVGLVLIAAGVALLAAGNAGTAERLGRLAGILILVGLAVIVAAAMGWF